MFSEVMPIEVIRNLVRIVWKEKEEAIPEFFNYAGIITSLSDGQISSDC